MTDTWAAFNPQPASDDPWAAFKPEAAAKPAPETGIDADRASPFVSSPSEAGFAASVPDAFLDRVRRGQALGRVLKETLKGAQEGFGDEPIAGSDEHLDHLLRELSIQRHDPASKAGPLMFDMVTAGVQAVKQTPLLRGLAAAVDTSMRGINSALHAGAGGVGQILDEAGGDGAGARKEIINFGNFAMIEAGFGRFSRPKVGMGDQPIGGLPKDADFKTAATVLGAEAAETRLRDLWEERGIHPAEAAHDAQSDAFLRQQVTAPAIDAYHGSPHEFERFDISKIGSGEGAQSYGHGLYFAENRAVADSYKDMVPRAIPEGWKAEQTSSGPGQFDNWWRVTDPEGHIHKTSGVRAADDAIRNVMSTQDLAPPGHMYQVRINADREHFLDWDKPLSEQSEFVQDAIKKAGGLPGRFFGAMDRLAGKDPTGEYIFSGIGGKDAEASGALRDAGIPGIKYLDQGSRRPVLQATNELPMWQAQLRVAEDELAKARERGDSPRALAEYQAEIDRVKDGIDRTQRHTEEGTSNFVLFDHDLVEITHKNGIALRDMSLEDAIEVSQGDGLFSAVGADVPRAENMPSLAQQPAPPPGRLAAAIAAVSDKLFDIGRDIQMKVAPMATGTRDTMALAKDFANAMRRNRWEWARIDDDVAGRFTPEQRKRMWDAADEESVARQLGESREHQGLVTLTADERAAVEDLQSRAQVAWLKAVDLGMVEGEGLPAYTPRMVVNVATAAGSERGLPLNGIGRNLSVRTPQMRHRKHMTAEETEAAAKAALGQDAELARDIRVLPLATAKLEDAIAGRTMIDNIKEYGRRTGDDTVTEGASPGEGWFTIDHPAFRTWRPRLEEADTATYREAVARSGGVEVEGARIPARDAAGDIIFEQVPIYVHGEFEGTLRAVLTQPSGATYQAFMALKGKTMSLIMNSPMIHNAVEWGRALPAMPGKVATFRVYFEGNRAKKDVPTMHEAIDGGLVPIGKRFFNQDVTSIMEAPDLTPGRSWTAKVLGFVPGLFDEAAGTAVKTAIDKTGDFWHNTLLWDRIGDLQMGLYVNLRDDMVAKGIDRQTAVRTAAHWANRYAGALPQEAMSDGARKISNVLMFSRSFTLGNLGAMKDMLTGLPKDVLAQIERDAGFRAGSINEAGELNGPAEQAVRYAKTMARRKAMAIVGLDIALMYVGNSILQSALNVMVTDRTLGEELHSYAQRFVEKMQSIREHPLELLQPFGFFQSLSATADNEPGRENRIHVGETKDGTAIYARNPSGKIGEEFEGYLTGPLDMVRRKLGTIARPAWQIMSNDAGFGRKIVDPTADTPAKYLKNIGAVAGHLVRSQFPEGQFDAASDLIKGEGDAKLNALQAFGPLAGVTFSKGAPGGPAVGELYHAREMHNFQVNAALPEIRKQFQRGDLAEARQRMNELGIPPGLQRFYEQTSINPATARMRGRTLTDFYRYATPEQRERLDRARTQ